MSNPQKSRQQSLSVSGALSGALSISLGLSSSYSNTANRSLDQANYLGRSYLGFNSIKLPNSNSHQTVITDTDSFNADDTALHDQTVFSETDDQDFQDYDNESNQEEVINETNILLSKSHPNYTINEDLEAQLELKSEQDSKITVTKVVGYIPSVILGLLLNILDGLSYGMIIFPIGEKIFSNLGPAGLSMFYVSCIVSQLVYSLGGSAFGAGMGSEMIEVTPFFHTMAANITKLIGEDQPDAVIATTITTYAISSMLTGVVFYLLGRFNLGQLVGFFPRHILIGCIGGVGYFLIITGIEISSRLGGFEYNYEFLSALFEFDNFLKVFIPLVLTIALVLLQHYYKNSLVLPSYFIAVFALSHLLILVVPQWDLTSARESGYLFSSDEETTSAPWYDFYRLYDFKIVHWSVIAKQVPSMFTLTFFGILHVPINVPALAVSTKQDVVDVDRELVAHGLSNFISGLVGSIQNYLVYTNSLLFIRAGADSRVAGVMLALATFGVLLVGPVVVGFIPVCVVGSLIFLLGYELLKEALYDTWSRVNFVEYLTILTIVLIMGIYDFVAGIIAGIIIASFHFLYENTQIPIITSEFTGEVARSTVVRHPLQRQFLLKLGKQIYVLKLQSYLFFGTIGKIEKKIKSLFDEQIPVRYLILDFKNVLSIDFSAAEGLNRIKNFLFEKNVYLIISLGDKPTILKSLNKVGIYEDSDQTKLHFFHNLNSSLEWCENEFLRQYQQFQQHLNKVNDSRYINKNHSKKSLSSTLPINTPRNTNFFQEAHIRLKKESTLLKTNATDEVAPLVLLLKSAFQGISNKDEKFWASIPEYFEQRIVNSEDELSFDPNESYFILIENGLLKIKYLINETSDIYETYLPKTIIGRLQVEQGLSKEFSYNDRFESKITAQKDSIIWVIKDSKLRTLRETNLEMYNELLSILFVLNDERFENVTGYSFIST